MAKLASRVHRGVGTPDGLDAKGLARGYLALEAENKRLREALEQIARFGVSFDAKGTRSKQVNEIAREALRA